MYCTCVRRRHVMTIVPEIAALWFDSMFRCVLAVLVVQRGILIYMLYVWIIIVSYVDFHVPGITL